VLISPLRRIVVGNSMVGESLRKTIEAAFAELGLDAGREIHLEHPQDPEHGDYATNAALVVYRDFATAVRSHVDEAVWARAQDIWRSPRDLAEALVKRLEKPPFVERIEVAGPGFINFFLSEEFLGQEVSRVLEERDAYGSNNSGSGKRILLEHTSPDPIKTIHIGHLRNNFLGMCVSRLLERCGYTVVKDCVNNDRGAHVSRSMWGYLVFGRKDGEIAADDLRCFNAPDDQVKAVAQSANWRPLLDAWCRARSTWLEPRDLGLKPDHFNLRFYSLGARAVNLIPDLEEQIRELLQAWEAGDKKVRRLWRQIIDWSLEGYEETYRRIGNEFDHVWYESDLYGEGKEIVREGLARGVFRKLPDGAVLSDLSAYGLSDTILLKSDGTTLYHTFDLGLTKRKRELFPSNLYIWCIGSEQTLYLQQLFAMCEQLGIGKRGDYFHLSYGYVTLKGKGKMSSRSGTIVSADEILDLLHRKAEKIISDSASHVEEIASGEDRERVAEAVALAAVKCALLRHNREKDIEFDLEESVRLEGDSGPYLQYTYARCRSVLRKAQQPLELTGPYSFGEGARPLLRLIYRFPEVISEAAKAFSPSTLCNFLFDLAQEYNFFYNHYPILRAENEELRGARLALTGATAQLIKTGLELLGIEPLERM